MQEAERAAEPRPRSVGAFVGRRTEIESALEALRGGRSVEFVGRAGVGKSRLLAEVAEQFSDAYVLRLVATEATRTVPFAALAPLLPPHSAPDLTRLFFTIRDAVVGVAAERRIVVAVDDAHHLDPASVALLTVLADEPSVSVALTRRSDAVGPAGLDGLLSAEVFVRVDVGLLDRADIGRIVGDLLGSVEPALVDRLWELSAGNPLVLREAVHDAVRSEAIEIRSRRWTIVGSLASGPRLSELVRRHLDGLPESERSALAHLAVGGHLPMEIVADAVGHDLTESLETRGLVVTDRQEDGSLSMRPSHPLYGEVLAAGLPTGVRLQILRRLARATGSAGHPSGADELRAALWLEESGDRLDHPDVMVAAAAIALGRHDPELAERLVRPIWAVERSEEAALVLGRALSYLGELEEAETVFGAVDGSAELSSARAHNLGFAMGQVDEAIDVLEVAGREADDAERGRLDAERAMFEAMRGGLAATESASESVLANPAIGAADRAVAGVTLVLARTMMADLDGAFETLPGALEAVRAVHPQPPMLEDQLLNLHTVALVGAGRLETADIEARERLATIGDAAPAAALWSYQRAMVAMMRGDLVEARSCSQRALAAHERTDPLRTRLIALGIDWMARGQSGDCSALGEDPPLPIDGEPRLAAWIWRGWAWAAAASGDEAAAASTVTEAARASIGADHMLVGAWTAYDAVRLRSPESGVELLDEAVRRSSGCTLAETMRGHAVAAVDGDPEALRAVAGRFAEFGSYLYAAEAASDAARRLQDAGHEVEARRAATAASVWLERCPGAVTPLVRSAPRGLTARQLEVAERAATGATSAEIADGLYLSVRTVDNHLRAIYRSLGVGGREELGGVLPQV